MSDTDTTLATADDRLIPHDAGTPWGPAMKRAADRPAGNRRPKGCDE